MLFTKKLRDRVKSGEITTSIRIWKQPRVKIGNKYQLDDGHIVVSAIREISIDDISESVAKESGFKNKVDLLKTAKHGSGMRVFFVRFSYEE
ncbi:MAG: ASCH domain-containing protein [Pseudomonadales bacterium]|nr:ASCH domain-containing protein [Pseudomonadales bacterium]